MYSPWYRGSAYVTPSLSGQVLKGVLPDFGSCGNVANDESASGTCANPDAAGRGAGEEGADVKQAGADNVIEYEPPNLVSGAGHDALPLAQLTKVESFLRLSSHKQGFTGDCSTLSLPFATCTS